MASLFLHGAQLLDPIGRERQQLVERGARQRRALRGRLHLDQAAFSCHNDVGVDLRIGVLAVVEVEQRGSAHDAAGDGRDRAGQRRALDALLALQVLTGEGEGDVGAGDRGAAGATVGLQHVAVEVDGAFPERVQVDDDAQRATDQALDSTERPSRRPLEMSRALRSPVEAGSMPYSAVSQPRPLPVIQRGTPSCAEAVQMTRVSPIEISAEPVAVRTNPGSISTGRS